MQGPWTGAYRDAAQSSSFKKYFGGYDTFSEEFSKKVQNSSKWRVPHEMQGEIPVSYTHLTLPTNREV